MKNKELVVQGIKIRIEPIEMADNISLTDIAKKSDRNEPKYLIRNWLKNNNTLEFLSTWESIFNPKFINMSHPISNKYP